MTIQASHVALIDIRKELMKFWKGWAVVDGYMIAILQ